MILLNLTLVAAFLFHIKILYLGLPLAFCNKLHLCDSFNKYNLGYFYLIYCNFINTSKYNIADKNLFILNFETGQYQGEPHDLPVRLFNVLHAFRLECEKSMLRTAWDHRSFRFLSSLVSKPVAAKLQSPP